MSNRQLAKTDSARGVMMIDLRNINYGAARGAIDKYIKSVGGGEGGNKSNFPGDQISYKKGEFYRGIGEQKRPVKIGTQIVFNIPNMGAGWVKWEDVDGKLNKKGDQLRLPKYTPLVFPAAGQDPIERESLGDLDKSQWEPDDYGNPADPWKPVLVFPVRSSKAGDETIHHMLLETVSKVIAGFNLFRDVMEEMKLHPGELPVVTIGTKKASMDKAITAKKGNKSQTKKVTWDVPTFEVTGWVDAIDADNPGLSGGVQVTDDGDDADLGVVTSKARVAAKKGKTVLAKTQPVGLRKAEAAKKSRKVVEAVEDDDSDTL